MGMMADGSSEPMVVTGGSMRLADERWRGDRPVVTCFTRG